MRDLEIEKALNVEKALLELVKSRQEKVKRLQRELEVLRAHKKFLSESLSVPTFPRGILPFCYSMFASITIALLTKFLLGTVHLLVHRVLRKRKLFCFWEVATESIEM